MPVIVCTDSLCVTVMPPAVCVDLSFFFSFFVDLFCYVLIYWPVFWPVF